jgi:hypothetical protein
MQPDLSITGVTVAQFAAIQRQRERMLKVVHREVEAYLSDVRLVFDGDQEGFPHRGRLTGRYYVSSESYIAHHNPTWIQISIMCRCLEAPKPGVGREDDYLGLEVWLKCVPDRRASFEVFRNTDSSSI